MHFSNLAHFPILLGNAVISFPVRISQRNRGGKESSGTTDIPLFLKATISRLRQFARALGKVTKEQLVKKAIFRL
jgi:hypothetical protein